MGWQLALKIAVSVAIIIGVTEISRRSTFWGALLASLPLTSLLAFVWLYADSGDARAVAALSQGIFWLVLASLPLFLILPALVRAGWGFWPSLGAACVATVGCYVALAWLLARAGVRI